MLGIPGYAGMGMNMKSSIEVTSPKRANFAQPNNQRQGASQAYYALTRSLTSRKVSGLDETNS